MSLRGAAWLQNLLGPVGRFLARRLERPKVRFVCATVLVLSTAVLVLSIVTAKDNRTIFGPNLGADYPQFYVAGTILNNYPGDRLYDQKLHDRLLRGLLPHMPAKASLPYFNPPFFAGLLRPLALLPYTASFVAWLLISLLLYIAGLQLLWRTREALGPDDRPLFFLLALSFEPFVMQCLQGGQLSAFGFFWLALALYAERYRRPLLSGWALGFLLYKPTLLALLLPFLVLSRRWRMLAGFSLCALMLAGVSLLLVGWAGGMGYLNLLATYFQAKTSLAGLLPGHKFVDLASFSRLLQGDRTDAGWVVTLVLASVAFLFLAVAWWRFPRAGPVGRKLIWAGTLTATLVVNVHVGIYDVVLVVPGVLWTADALCQKGTDAGLSAGFRIFLVLLYLTPWFSEGLALQTGFQAYTLVLAAFGIYQFTLAWRSLSAGRAADPALQAA